MANITVAAHVVVVINGRKWGKAMSFRWSSAAPKRPIYGLDSSMPYELAVTTTQVSGSVSFVPLMGDGGLEGDGITPPTDTMVRERYFTLDLIDTRTGTPLFTAENCVVESQTAAVNARGLLERSFDFRGISWSNDATVTR